MTNHESRHVAPMLDRIAPTRRPTGPHDGTQTWESLLFCHWEIPVATLQRMVPMGLEIDTFEGRAFIGVVPFKMRHIRPRWLPAAWAFNFLETNVRTYVVHKGRPGVYFFSLDASSRFAVWAARTSWSLQYYYANMTATQSRDRHTYRSHRSRGRARHHVAFRVNQELGPSRAGSLEHFLLERYLMFVVRRGRICVGQVHHRAYQAYTAVVDEFEDQLIPAAGLPKMSRLPDLVHYCPGVDVEVFGIVHS